MRLLVTAPAPSSADTLSSLFPTIEPIALEAGLEATFDWMRGYLASAW